MRAALCPNAFGLLFYSDIRKLQQIERRRELQCRRHFGRARRIPAGFQCERLHYGGFRRLHGKFKLREFQRPRRGFQSRRFRNGSKRRVVSFDRKQHGYHKGRFFIFGEERGGLGSGGERRKSFKRRQFSGFGRFHRRKRQYRRREQRGIQIRLQTPFRPYKRERVHRGKSALSSRRAGDELAHRAH